MFSLGFIFLWLPSQSSTQETEWHQTLLMTSAHNSVGGLGGKIN